jgi:putative oxidoreductase
MNVLLRLYTDFIGGRPGVGLLLFRIVTGLALMQHGFTKIQHPTSWMGDSGVPPLMQALAAICEFGGGLGILLGLLTPLACIGVMCVMIGALMLVHLPAHQPWVGKGVSMELPISYLIAAITLFCTGPGVFSLDAKLFGTRLRSRSLETPIERRKVAA